MVNAGLLSKGTTLSYIENGNIKTVAGVKSIPTVGSDPEKVDVTNLGSSKKRYVKGLQDTDNLEFSVIYKGENFKDIHRLVELDKPLEWLVMYPDGMTVRFTGEVMQKIDGVEVNAAVGFSIVIVVSEGPSIEFAKEPQRPTELKASNIQFDQFDLSWSGSGLFRVYVDRQKVGETYNNTFTVTGLKPSSKHIVSVASVSGVNEVHTVPITVTTTELPKITKINVPQRLDLYVDETKQLDVSTVPLEAMRAYEHVNKAMLDNSIVKFDGDNVTGIKSVNDDSLGRNYILESQKHNNKIFGYGWNISFTLENSLFEKSGDMYLSFYLKIEEDPNNANYAKIRVSGLEKLLTFKVGTEEYKKLKNKYVKQIIVFEKDDIQTEKNIFFLSASEEDGKFSILNPQISLIESDWTPAPEDNYSYTNAKVVFNDKAKSEKEFEVFVHERKRMTSPTESDTASFIL